MLILLTYSLVLILLYLFLFYSIIKVKLWLNVPTLLDGSVTCRETAQHVGQHLLDGNVGRATKRPNMLANIC